MIVVWLIFIAVSIRYAAIIYNGQLMEYVYINLPKRLGCPFCVGYNLGVVEGIVWGILFSYLYI